MIVCVCRGVSDRQLQQALQAGISCLGQLRAEGIGDCCGACNPTLHALIDEHTGGQATDDPCLDCPNQRRLAS